MSSLTMASGPQGKALRRMMPSTLCSCMATLPTISRLISHLQVREMSWLHLRASSRSTTSARMGMTPLFFR